MKSKRLIKIISLLLSLCITLSSIAFGGLYAYSETLNSQAEQSDEETTAAQPSEEENEQAKEDAQNALQNQLDQIAKDLDESEKKLLELGAQSKTTEEYINALDEKIGFLNQQLDIIDSVILRYQEDIDALQLDIDKNQVDVDALQLSVDEVQSHLDKLNAEYNAKYEAYCMRARAIYISGHFSVISALLLCDDISSFLTRYEMIKSVSKSDAQLLKEIEAQTEEILKNETELTAQKAELDGVQNSLVEKRNRLTSKQDVYTKAQEEQARRKVILASDKAESDMLLQELNAKNGMYTEFRNEDKTLIDAIENDISDLLNGIKNPDDITLATTSDRDDVTIPTYSKSDVYNNSDAVLNMTYPAPGNYTVSCAFGKYSNGNPHNGIDFPAVKGSKIVAAQNGVVIKTQKLNYSYGYYVMIYHGTDSSGKTVVTLYAHNSEILVSPGDTVVKGQQIAKSGSTGNSTGPHCHFEIRMDNKPVNPSIYLNK